MAGSYKLGGCQEHVVHFVARFARRSEANHQATTDGRRCGWEPRELAHGDHLLAGIFG